MKTAFVFVLITAIICGSGGMPTNKPLWHQLDNYEFEQYVLDFEKEHSSTDHPEFFYRKMIFENNLRKIREHNADETQSWKMGVNKFADMTQAEMNRFKGLAKKRVSEYTNTTLLDESQYKIKVEDLPDTFDWND